MQEKQWQYGLNIYSGVFLFSLPWLLRFDDALPIRSWDFFVIGVAIIGFSALAMHKGSRRAKWADMILGIWMIASPWVLGFDQNLAARYGALAVGVLVFLVSLWAFLERTQVQPGATGAVASRM